MKSWKILLSAVAAALVVVGCGGGGSTSTTTVPFFKSVKVVGDSLSDSGVFGYKWAMQGNAANPMKVWPEIVADAYGVSALCPYYSGASAGGAVTPSATGAACNNYAVGGARVNFNAAPTSAYSITQQLATLAANKPYVAGDLLLVDGGGNDVAALAGAYLGAAGDSGAAFVALTSSLLGSASVTQIIVASGGPANPNALPAVGRAYMKALADSLYTAVKTQALDKGATNVLVLNVPDIAGTPRFVATLDLVSASAGTATSAQVKGLIGVWATDFNTQLATKFAGNTKVAIADFYTDIQAKIATPANFGLTNITTPACPRTGTGPNGTDPADGLPKYTPPTCTVDALSANPPAGVTDPNWWKTYYFSDGFHPSIKGYQLLAADVLAKLAAVGWK
jgi:outer membrane lipase/esterase